MAFAHGKDGHFELDNSGGTLTDITAYVTDVSITQNGEVVETTTLGDTDRAYLAGLKNATLSVSGLFDGTVHAILQAAIGTQRSFEYGPQGETSGDVKLTGECFCTDYSPSIGLGGAGTWSASFQITGAVTDSTYA